MRKMKRLTWDETKITAFQEALVSWYEANKRVLPWREKYRSLQNLGLRNHASTNKSRHSNSLF